MKPIALVLATALIVSGCSLNGRGRLGITGLPTAVAPATAPSSVSALANLGGFTGVLAGPSALISNNAGSLIANNGGGLVSNGSGNLVSNGSGNYRLAGTATLAPVAGATVVVTDASGHPLSAEVTSDAQGRFRIASVSASGALVFVRARYRVGDRDASLVAAVDAPRAKGLATADLDPATTLVGKAIAARLAAKGSGATPAEAAKIAGLLRNALSDAAVERACLGSDAQADDTFSQVLAASPAIADAVHDAAPSGDFKPASTTTTKTSAPSGSAGSSGSSGGGAPAPTPTPTPTPTPIPGPVTVTGFDRPSAIVGGHITLTGTGFSTTLVDNAVDFGGAAATVVAATATTLEVVVPEASSVAVTVTVNGNSGTSPKALEIVPTSGGFVAALSASGLAVTATSLWALNQNNDNASVTPLAGGAGTTHGIDHLPIDIAKDPAGNFFVACQESGVIKVSPSGAVTGRFDAAASAANDDVHALAVDPADGSVWAVNFDFDNVTKLTNTGAIVGTFPVGDQPRGVAVGTSSDAWVANSNGTLTHLRTDGSVFRTVDIGNVPWGLAVDGNGHVWVTLVDRGELVELDATGTELGRVSLGTVTRSIVLDDNGAVWVPNGTANTVTRVGTNRAIEGVYALAGTPTYAARGEDGRIWVLGTGDQKATAFTIDLQPITIN